MRKLITTLLLSIAAFISACSNPNDIVLGPDPLKQMVEQSDKFKKLPEEDRMLLVGFVGLKSMAQAFGAKDAKPITGRTVGEVLVDARAWKATMLKQDEVQKTKDAETAQLRAKVEAERKIIVNKLSEAVTVAVVSKTIRPQDYSAQRLYDQLELVYAVENKTDKDIRQFKGTLEVLDATGDVLGSLPVDFSELFKAHGTVKTDTGFVWKIKRYTQGNIEKIADAQFDGMKTRFKVEVIAYADGEVVKAPDLP